jgi:hypothetical protein
MASYHRGISAKRNIGVTASAQRIRREAASAWQQRNGVSEKAESGVAAAKAESNNGGIRRQLGKKQYGSMWRKWQWRKIMAAAMAKMKMAAAQHGGESAANISISNIEMARDDAAALKAK